MQDITSPQNPRLKQLLKLHSSRGRKQQNRIVIFGWRELKRAIECGVDIEEVFVCPELCGELVDKVVAANTPHAFAMFSLPREVFSKVQYGDRSDGVIGIAKRPNPGFDVEVNDDSFFLVLQGLEKPGNLGAVLRTADGAGVSGVIVVDAVTDVFHPNSIRASMGTVFSTPVTIYNSSQAIDWLQKSDVKVFVTLPASDSNFFEADLSGRIAIVLGSESDGLTKEWRRPEFASVQLPMLGIADSLNVSVATGIVAYEACRQRSQSKGK